MKKTLTGAIAKLIKCMGEGHSFKHVRNIYGDEINYVNGKRSEWYCEKCGKRKLEDELFVK